MIKLEIIEILFFCKCAAFTDKADIFDQTYTPPSTRNCNGLKMEER